MRKLFKKSIACLLAAVLCATLCVCAITASAETPTYSTNEVVTTAGAEVQIDFTVANFAAVQGAMIKLSMPEAIESIVDVKLNGADLAAYNDDDGTGYYVVEGTTIKFIALFGEPFGELASVECLTFNITANVKEDAADGNYAYPAPVFSMTEDGETLVAVTGSFAPFTVAPATVEPDVFDAEFRYIVTVQEAVGASIIFTKPENIDTFNIKVNRTTFTNKYAFTPADEIVWTPADAYLTSGAMYGYSFFELALYELSMDVTLTVEGYKNGDLVAVSNPVVLKIADLIAEKVNAASTSVSDRKIYSEILWLGDAALSYFKKTAGSVADINTVASPAADITTEPVATYSPVTGTPTMSEGATKISSLRTLIGAAPSIQFMMSGLTEDLLANGSFSATYTSGMTVNKKPVGDVTVSAPLKNEGAMMIAGNAGAYLHSKIYLADSNKAITATIVDGEGNVVATATATLAQQIATALAAANPSNTELVNIYTRLLIFGEVATEYFHA